MGIVVFNEWYQSYGLNLVELVNLWVSNKEVDESQKMYSWYNSWQLSPLVWGFLDGTKKQSCEDIKDVPLFLTRTTYLNKSTWTSECLFHFFKFYLLKRLHPTSTSSSRSPIFIIIWVRWFDFYLKNLWA